jgi:hypothetical protein
MTPMKWHQVKALLGVKLPKRPSETVERTEWDSSKSKTQTDSVTESVKRTLHHPALPHTPELNQQPFKVPHALVVGQIVAGRFEILRFINSGGMGEVYEGWDSVLGERIALKTIRPEIASSPFVIDRFKKEVKQARVISQVNVCRVYEVFSLAQSSGDRIWFLTMELLEGETLSHRLRRQGPIPVSLARTTLASFIAISRAAT